MFKKSKVSFKGRCIITAIFALCIVIPELLVIATAGNNANSRFIICFAVVRLIWSAPLWYYTMMGYTWARNITIALLILGVAGFTAFINAKTYYFLIPPIIFDAAGAAILLYLEDVRSQEFKRKSAKTGTQRE